MEEQLLNDSFASTKKTTKARLEDRNVLHTGQLQLESIQDVNYHLVLTVWDARATLKKNSTEYLKIQVKILKSL